MISVAWISLSFSPPFSFPNKETRKFQRPRNKFLSEWSSQAWPLSPFYKSTTCRDKNPQEMYLRAPFPIVNNQNALVKWPKSLWLDSIIHLFNPFIYLTNIYWASTHGGGNGNPLQYTCLKNSMGKGVWWATVHGVAKIRNDWAFDSIPLSIYTSFIKCLGYINEHNKQA